VPRSATPTRDRLLDAAEDLVARHGPDAVSTRQILAAAGAGNMAAIQYHFGTKDGLLAAVVARVLEPLERDRAAELAALGASADVSLHDECLAYVRPMVRLRAGEHGRRAAGVMGRVLGSSRDQLERIGVTTDATDAAFAARFARHMPAMGDRERHLRLQAALAVVVFYALGYTEHPGHGPGGVDETAASLATVVAAVLAAPAASSDPSSGSRTPGA
jgi:AcrR family transcriptional regulator